MPVAGLVHQPMVVSLDVAGSSTFITPSTQHWAICIQQQMPDSLPIALAISDLACRDARQKRTHVLVMADSREVSQLTFDPVGSMLGRFPVHSRYVRGQRACSMSPRRNRAPLTCMAVIVRILPQSQARIRASRPALQLAAYATGHASGSNPPWR